MFMHGENDNDVPIAEAEQFYIALKDVGVETVMVRYPREGHGIRETKHVVDSIDPQPARGTTDISLLRGACGGRSPHPRVHWAAPLGLSLRTTAIAGRCVVTGIHKWLSVGLFVMALFLISSPRVHGQGGTGQIEGAVFDEQGGVLPGVTVTLQHQATGVQRVTVTEADGRYRFPALGPGRYTLGTELTGFAPQEVRDIEMTIGLALRQDFSMKVGALSESIVVSGLAPVVDTTKAEVSGVVTQQQIEALPINSRQYLSLALLMPGTSVDATRSFFPTVNVGGSMSFNSTGNVVDGMINNMAEDGEPRQNLPQDAVEEFKVSNMQFPAEFGLATGGIVQVVTKSGTNAFTGSAFE